MSELIKLAQAGDEKAMAELIHENIGLVWNIVRRFMGRGCETEDLFQIGVLGFVKAIKRFDLSYDNKLSTYAVSMIIGEIRRFLRDDGIIKVSRGLKEIYAKINELKEFHMKQYGVELTLQEISDMLQISKEDIILAEEANSAVDSLDKPISDDNDRDTVYNTISEEKNDYDILINKMTIESAIENLTKEERKIIIYRYYRDMTQSQIADLIGTSQVQVSRIEKRALEKMRKVGV